jgi:thiol-disulfide isomerase/thioredoxin
MDKQTLVAVLAGTAAVLAGILMYRGLFFEPQIVSAPKPSPSLRATQNTLSLDEIQLQDISGETKQLSDWSSPVKIVNFWAPWCAPCRKEIPALIAVQEAYPQIQILGFSFDSRENVDNFSKDYAFNYPLLLVGEQSYAINQAFGNSSSALPYTVILNGQHEIVFSHHGEISQQQLETALKVHL